MSQLQEVADEIKEILRLRTLPLAVKFFSTEQEIQAIPKIRMLQEKISFCQYVTLARTAGWTLGITAKSLGMPACLFMLGLVPLPKEGLLDGAVYENVWQKTREDAAKYQQAMPRLPYGKHKAVVLSPANSDRLENPDLVLIYGSPGQIHLLMNALQWEDYERFQFYFTGESSCSDSLVECYQNHKPFLSIPCYGQRRFGQVQDDEIELAVPPDQMMKALTGLHGLRKAGTASYPILSYGSLISPIPVVNQVYPGLAKYIESVERGEFPEKIR